MSQEHAEASPFVVQAGEASLSGPALAELMDAVLDRGVPFRFQAKGWSMFPFVRDGDVLTVSPQPGGPPGLGEVVAFCHPVCRRIVIHRVTRRFGDSFVTRGDNSEDEDGRIPVADLLGRVTRIERRGRRVFLGLGAERVLIALLTRSGIVPSVLVPAWQGIRRLLGRAPPRSG